MLNRRKMLTLLSGSVMAPTVGFAATPSEIVWDDLIPKGVPYSQIIGEGELDEVNDLWNPIYDANSVKLNEDLDGAYIKMPGYIIPLEVGAKGVKEFMLVPYVGACIHTPPPPANSQSNTRLCSISDSSGPSKATPIATPKSLFSSEPSGKRHGVRQCLWSA